MPLERHRDPLLPRPAFLRRLFRSWGAATGIVLGSWLLGTLGYRITEGMAWLDALLNAAMILGGMGPVDPLHTAAGKVFAAMYALFSGIVFLVAVGVLVTPIVHRLYHRFHVEERP